MGLENIGALADALLVKEKFDSDISNVRSIGTTAQTDAELLGSQLASDTQFQPFTVTTGTGTTKTTDEGGFTTSLSPQAQALQTGGLTGAQNYLSAIGQDPMSTMLASQAQQAYQGLGPSALTGLGVADYQGIGQNPMQQALLAQASRGFANIGTDPRQQALLSRADTAFSRAGVDPSIAQAEIYNQMRAAQRPEEERQSLALEERMLAQGRGGIRSAAYGGSSPELLAQETARQEAMARANLGARSQAMQEQQQAYGQGLGFLGQASGMRAQELAEASGLLGAGYTPQQMELARAQARFGAGMTQEQADLGRAQALQGASYLPQQQDLAMATGLMGIGYTPEQQSLAALGYGLEGGKLALTGQTAGAEFEGQLGQVGLQSKIQAEQVAAMMEQAIATGMFDVLAKQEGSITGSILDAVIN
jgi:hypothetical protein